MRSGRVRVACLGLASLSMIGTAWADDFCAGASDVMALETAAVQQELTVAGLACNQADLYNAFVLTYRPALQSSDADLHAYFLRLSTPLEYDSFKTKLANEDSLASARDKRAYCGHTQSVFRAALTGGRKSLAEFVLAQPVSISEMYPVCGERVAGGETVAAPPVQFPSPTSPSADSYRAQSDGPSRALRARRYDPRGRYSLPYDPYWYGPPPEFYLRRR